MKENQLRPNELNWILQIQALYVLLSQTLLYLEDFFYASLTLKDQ